MIYTVISRNQAIIRTNDYKNALRIYYSKKQNERTEYPQSIRFKAQSELTGKAIYLMESLNYILNKYK